MKFAATSFARYDIGADAYGDGISAWVCNCCEVPDGAEWLYDADHLDSPTCKECGAEAGEDEEEDE